MLTSLLQWRKRIGVLPSRTEFMQQVVLLPLADQPAAASLYPVIDDHSILRMLHTFEQPMTVPQARQDQN